MIAPIRARRRWVTVRPVLSGATGERCSYARAVAYDEELAERIRERPVAGPALSERKMFGGLCFMIEGNMCFGIVGSELMVRVGLEAYDAALSQPHAREMDFTGRSMRGMVFVAEEGLSDDEELDAWLERGARFAGSLPPK